MPAPGQAAVVGKCLGESHADARTRRCGKSNEECVPTIMGGEGSGEDRSECGDRAIHQSGETWLHNLEDKQAPLRTLFIFLDAGRQLFFVEFLSAFFVFAFFVDQIVEQLSDAGVLRAAGGLFVEAAGVSPPRARASV